MQAISNTRREAVAQAVTTDAKSAPPAHVSGDLSKYPYGLPRDVANRLDARTKAKLSALAIKRALRPLAHRKGRACRAMGIAG